MRIKPSILIAIFVALLAVATGQWFYFKAQFLNRLPALEARAKDAGVNLSYTARTIKGFPFRLEAHYADAKLSFTAPQLSFALAAQEMVLIRQLLKEDLSLLYFDSPQFAAAAEGPLPNGKTGEINMTWRAPIMQASLRSAGQTLTRLSTVIDQPVGQTQLAGIGTFDAKQMQFHMNWPGNNQVILNAQATNLSLKDAQTGPLPQMVNKVQIGTSIAPDGGYPLEPMGLASWQQAGGRVQLTQFEVDWDDIHISQSTGTLRLEDDLTLKGQIRLSVVGLPALTYAIDKTDVLGPQEEFALLTLRLSRAGMTAENAVPLDFDVTEGLLRLGPAPLVRLGPVAQIDAETR